MVNHNVEERRRKIIEILKRDKFSTMKEIASECKASVRTIRNDLKYLRNHFPQIVVKKGGVDGGVYFEED